jgi:iron complex transport system ATP-binding protein
MADGDFALIAQDVSVALGARRAVTGVSFEADFCTITAVLGPNGAGKTTLLRALAGIVPHAGRVELCGGPIESLDPRERSKRLAFVPQRSQLASRLPVYTVVSHGRFAHRGGLSRLLPADRQAIDTAMMRADVAHLAAREFPELSHGEQRRVLLARALATEARVLLLDEPTASLDIPHALSLFATLRGLAEDGRCVVVVVHQLDDALRFTDRALLLHDGRQVAFGRSPEVITADNVERVYGVQLIAGGALGFRLGGSPP